jgi:hypothetical protein
VTRADSGAACSEYLGVRRQCKGRVHPGAGYPTGLPRDSGRGTPWVTTGQVEVPVREVPTASTPICNVLKGSIHNGTLLHYQNSTHNC